MVQCEMCGAETGSPTTVKIEVAELEVCDDCTEFGTEIRTQETETTSTKYSTDTSSSPSGSASSTSGSTTGDTGGSSGGGGRRDMFDEMDQVVSDYDDRIQNARESGGLTQAELADRLNEKASLIRKLERGDVLPSDRMQRKLERELDLSLTAGGDTEDSEWSGGSAPGETTLGDVVKRKD